VLPVDPSDFRSHGMAACTQQGPAGPSGRLWYGTAVEHSADMRRLENRERPLRTMATTAVRVQLAVLQRRRGADIASTAGAPCGPQLTVWRPAPGRSTTRPLEPPPRLEDCGRRSPAARQAQDEHLVASRYGDGRDARPCRHGGAHTGPVGVPAGPCLCPRVRSTGS
jgi:hypothetical protein